MFVGWSDHFVHEIDHPLVGYMGGDALNGNVVIASIDCFLNPFVRQVFRLLEPVTAKDVARSKRWWCRSPRVFSDRWIIRTLGIPPGSIEDRGGVVYPLRARLVMELTKVFDRCSAKSF